MIGCRASGGGNERQQLQGRYRFCCSCVSAALPDSQLCTTEITKTTESHSADAGLNATFNRVREERLLADRATIVPARCRSAPDSVLVHLIGAQIWDA